jgi:hypothetical protein
VCAHASAPAYQNSQQDQQATTRKTAMNARIADGMLASSSGDTSPLAAALGELLVEVDSRCAVHTAVLLGDEVLVYEPPAYGDWTRSLHTLMLELPIGTRRNAAGATA